MNDVIYRQDAIDALDCINGTEEVLRSLTSAQSDPQWIPCNERLPEEDEQVFVYLFDASPYIAWFCDGRWHTEEFMLNEDEEPAAWMPLPEPYKERREE